MSNLLANYESSGYVTDNILIVPFQGEFFDEVISRLRSYILNRLHAEPKIKGLIIDLSKAKVISINDINILEDIIKMSALFEVKSYISGIQPAVTLSLVNLNYEPSQLNFCLKIEREIDLINDKKVINRIKDSQNGSDPEETQHDNPNPHLSDN